MEWWRLDACSNSVDDILSTFHIITKYSREKLMLQVETILLTYPHHEIVWVFDLKGLCLKKVSPQMPDISRTSNVSGRLRLIFSFYFLLLYLLKFISLRRVNHISLCGSHLFPCLSFTLFIVWIFLPIRPVSVIMVELVGSVFFPVTRTFQFIILGWYDSLERPTANRLIYSISP